MRHEHFCWSIIQKHSHWAYETAPCRIRFCVHTVLSLFRCNFCLCLLQQTVHALSYARERCELTLKQSNVTERISSYEWRSAGKQTLLVTWSSTEEWSRVVRAAPLIWGAYTADAPWHSNGHGYCADFGLRLVEWWRGVHFLP